MRVAITGATGFIGKQLVRRHVGSGHEVRVLTRDPKRVVERQEDVEVVVADLTTATEDELRGFASGADVLYHCAGELRNEARMRALHVDGTLRLARAAAGEGVRWVQLSSVGVYGRYRDGPVTEDAPQRPRGSYEATKAEADDVVLEASGRGDFPAVVLRPSIVFGEGMPSGSLRQLVRAVQRGQFFFIGPAGASANYVHIADVIEALMLCGARSPAGASVYNLSDWCTVEEFVEVIAHESGVAVPALRVPEWAARSFARTLGRLPGVPLTESRVDALVNRARYPTTLIERELGYRPTVGLKKGLAECVRAWTAPS